MPVNFETKIDFECEIDVDCEQCGASLVADISEYQGAYTISVKPCETCMDQAFDNGQGKGYDAGLNDGIKKCLK